ncbi:MAG: Gfo/Idh/MocA family oxidoreductase [Lentisphaeria bacterium]|nr:Gfo/Idh/MocA family oxidoreductase [Lentisphaeria bacterium]MDY0177324.1 Gfo/Idh/MocA family oxidoreductase [Lentisphaeria bacterium]NLZ59806.1 Gfo/Idh/MocA family oxidoreductase [Lentisphaerota bacterium]
MSSSSAIRFAAIGCGNAGTARICALAGHELGLKVVAGADLVEANLDNLASRLGYSFKHYVGEQAYLQMLDENELDAVGIFTPHIPHYEHVLAAMKKGLHVIIEKPMVCGAANALEVTRLMRESGKVGIIHYQRHYEAKFAKARELIQKGLIGEVKRFFIYMAQDWPGRTWRAEPEYSGGGQINDSGSHYLDILLWMLDVLPRSAEGHCDSFYNGKRGKVEFNGSFNVELENGAAGRVVFLADIPGGFVDDVRIIGSKGNLFFQGDRLIHYDAEKDAYHDMPTSLAKNYPSSPSDNFVKLLKNKVRINRVPFIFGCRVALLTEAMLRSAAQGGEKILCADILKESGHGMQDLLES